MNIKELLKDKKEIVIVLNEDNRKEFLKQANNEGLKWFTDRTIKEDDDECSFHVLVKSNFTIANLPTITLSKTHDFDNMPKFNY